MSTHKVSPTFLILLSYYLISMSNAPPAITYEQYTQLQGQQFCGTSSPDGLKTMCKHFATINSLPAGYQEQFMIAECQMNDLTLFMADGNSAPNTRESLLVCQFEYPVAPNSQGVWTNNPNNYYAGFGRGVGVNDVMEYRGSNHKYVPYRNLPNFFN